jgi:hypothetical protein
MWKTKPVVRYSYCFEEWRKSQETLGLRFHLGPSENEAGILTGHCSVMLNLLNKG